MRGRGIRNVAGQMEEMVNEVQDGNLEVIKVEGRENSDFLKVL